MFTVAPATGVVSMVARDFEAPADAGADNVYNVTLVVTDADANTASAAFTVTVTDVIETATLTLTKGNDTVAENTAYTGAAPTLGGTPIGSGDVQPERDRRGLVHGRRLDGRGVDGGAEL